MAFRPIDASSLRNGVDRSSADAHSLGDGSLRKAFFPQHSPHFLNDGCCDHDLALFLMLPGKIARRFPSLENGVAY